MQQLDEAVQRYLTELDRADRDSSLVLPTRVERLKQKLETIDGQLCKLKQIEQVLEQAPDGQVSLTDPDARSMATSGRGTGIVGYNVQTAVDLKHHLIVAHEVTNLGHDRTQLTTMASRAKEVINEPSITVLADRGYFNSEEILATEQAGVVPLVPKPQTSNNKARLVRQARLRVRRARRRVSMSSRTARHLQANPCRRWAHCATVLVFRVSELPAEEQVHDLQQ
jgi:hypothetical protein